MKYRLDPIDKYTFFCSDSLSRVTVAVVLRTVCMRLLVRVFESCKLVEGVSPVSSWVRFALDLVLGFVKADT